jgi:hypothetical protein
MEGFRRLKQTALCTSVNGKTTLAEASGDLGRAWSFGEKLLAEFRFRYKPACLPKYCVKGAAVDLLMIRNGQTL